MRKKYKIFDLDYLQTNEFTEEDLIYLFETPSFNYSLIVGMFNKYDNGHLSIDKIIDIISKDDKWMYKHFWTIDQVNEYSEIIKKCLYNLYRYKESICDALCSMWIAQYGFTNEIMKNKKPEFLSD